MTKHNEQIPHNKLIRFSIEPMSPQGREIWEEMTVERLTGFSKEGWNLLTRKEQDAEIDEAYIEWVFNNIDSGWNVVGHC